MCWIWIETILNCDKELSDIVGWCQLIGFQLNGNRALSNMIVLGNAIIKTVPVLKQVDFSASLV